MDPWVCTTLRCSVSLDLLNLSGRSGGYTTGSASATGQAMPLFYDGNDLVRASQGQVVAVLIQYRLGLFGFLAGQKVSEGGALNAGLRTFNAMNF